HMFRLFGLFVVVSPLSPILLGMVVRLGASSFPAVLFVMLRLLPSSTLFPYTTLFRSRLRQALARAEEVAQELADPETARNPAKLRQLGREHARLDQIRQAHERLDRLERELAQAREVLQDRDPELSQLARVDVDRVHPEITQLQNRLNELLTPVDPLADRDAIVEIRAGTGGDEAALFAAELF